MSKLRELIQQYCPDGVEYKPLSAIASIDRGTRVVKRQLSEEEGFPVYQNSLTPLGYYTNSNNAKNTPFVIIAGAAGDIGYSEEAFWAADDCLAVNCKDGVDSRFVYHVLLQHQSFIKSQVRKASIPRLPRDVIDRLEIPVPPLAVQEEIVVILSSLSKSTTDLKEELLAEIEVREKEYEYYRNELLTFKPKA